MSDVKFINKDNLRIARENAGFDVLVASKRISNSKKNLVSEWESGESLPTWSQVHKLSKLYGVAELLFFSNNLIEKNKIIPDYRVGVEQEDEIKVKKLINIVIKRQRWLEKELKAGGVKKNDFQGSGKDIRHPSQLADLIKEKLDIHLEEIKVISGERAREKTLDYLIHRAEDRGIFIGKTISYHRIGIEEMRGLFVSNDYCPFIVLNRRDAVSAQIFSLIHEFAHLFRKTDAISNSLDFRSTVNGVDSEEIFCNRVAVELLLPKNDFQKEFYNKFDIDKISDLYKVSKISIFYRLKDLGKIRAEVADGLEEEIKSEMAQNLKKKAEREKNKKGGNYINSMKDSNGDLFNKIVSNTYLENRIGYVEASNLLKFSVEKYE